MATAVTAASICSTGQAVTINSWVGTPPTDYWNDPDNWSTGNIPNSTDQATVYSGSVSLYQTTPTIGSLLVAKIGTPGKVFTNGFKLNVLNSVSLDGAGASLWCYNPPAGSVSLQSPIINVTNGAFLAGQLPGTKIRVSSNSSGTPNGTLTVDGTSTVYTGGTIDVGTYINNGLIFNASGPSTVNAGTFTLSGSASNTATIDTDYDTLTINATTLNLHNADTKIDVSDTGGNLTLNGDTNLAAGNIGSDVYVGESSQLNLLGGTYQFGYYTKTNGIFVPHGSVNLNGGTTSAKAAKVNEYAAYFTSVNVTGYATMAGGEFDGGATVNVAASALLSVNNAYFRGTSLSTAAAINGTGTVNLNGDTGIGYSGSGIPYTAVTVGAGTIFNWDGTSDTTATCDIENGELNINTSIIDVQTYFNGVPINRMGYDGTITVGSNSKLNVAGTAWTMYGSMNLAGSAQVQGQTMTLDGSNLPAGTYSLYPKGVAGAFPSIQAASVLKSNTTVYLGNGDGLNLNGPTSYAGVTFMSAPFINPGAPYGTVVQNGAATVTANSTMGGNTFDMDGTANATPWTINAGVTFTQQAWFLDTFNSATNSFHSTLTLNGGTLDMETHGGAWTLAGGTINMNGGGAFNLPFLTHDKLVLGSGALKGTINVGGNTTAYISGGLTSGLTSAAGGNVINVGANSNLYVGPSFQSDAGALLTKSGPGTMTVNVPQNHGVGSQINVVDGTLNLNSDTGGSGSTLAINATGGTVNFSTTQHLGSLTVGAGGKATMTLQASPAAHTVLSTGIAMTGGLLDLTGNDMIVHAADPSIVRSLIAQGYNGGTWTGSVGITSSAAAASASPKSALGYLLNNNGTGVKLFNTFDGLNTSLTDVLVKYTVLGDSNLDGTTDFADLVSLAQHYNGANTSWNTGDFNYDGITNFPDLVALAQNYNKALTSVQSSEIATLGGNGFVSDFALAQSLVPEPTTLGLLGLIAPAMVRRRSPR